jgi:carbonic anhydrase/acetyltransferase-like protein (isoleucine patch superfamily)
MLILPHHGVQPTIPPTAYIAPTATVIGDVVLGDQASIWFNTVVRGDVNFIRIGDRTNIQDNSMVHVTHDSWPTVIGSDVIVGHGVILHGCVIKDRVLVGMGSIVLDGVEVGEESILGAGSLLAPGTKIPPRSLVLGRPGKVVRKIGDQEVEDMILSGVRNYLKYKESYREE